MDYWEKTREMMIIYSINNAISELPVIAPSMEIYNKLRKKGEAFGYLRESNAKMIFSHDMLAYCNNLGVVAFKVTGKRKGSFYPVEGRILK